MTFSKTFDLHSLISLSLSLSTEWKAEKAKKGTVYMITKSFVKAGFGTSTAGDLKPSPLFRRSFNLKHIPTSENDKASLTVTGLGYYRVFVNGCEITRGHMSPYTSNPDDYIYFDRYDISEHLRVGENVIGAVVGAGTRCCVGTHWGFGESAYVGEMLLAFTCEIVTDGERLFFEADEKVKVHPSAITFSDLRAGEYYDARLEDETEGWMHPHFDDSDWKSSTLSEFPRGEHKICTAPPIKARKILTPVKIWEEDGAFVYDFGQNGAGVINIHSTLPVGRQIRIEFAEYLMDGKFYNDTIKGFNKEGSTPYRGQTVLYTAKGGRHEYTPSFTYEGFRYVKVHGVSKEEATDRLLTFTLMNTQMRALATFSSSDEILNCLFDMTREATYSNMFHIPTDCPHREKNGWTADAAVSAYHILMNLEADEMLLEWMRNVNASMNKIGALPGIVPTGTGWGYNHWNGPGWDAVLVELPYRLYELRSDIRAARVVYHSMFRYVGYVLSRRDEKGLVHIGLGDWVAPHNPIKAPLELTDSIICYDIARKAAVLYEAMGAPELERFCLDSANSLRSAVREHLIDSVNAIAAGNCQTSQAMAIYYGMFTEDEKEKAVENLVSMIHDCHDHLDTGVLGVRVLFRVLSENGYINLAHKIITEPTPPSYADMVLRGETTLVEDFNSADMRINSRNHHFLGDISAWFVDSICGIRINPALEEKLLTVVDKGSVGHVDGACRVDIIPRLPECMEYAEASAETPFGRVKIMLRRDRSINMVQITAEVEGDLTGRILPPEGYRFDGCGEYPLQTGVYDGFR